MTHHDDTLKMFEEKLLNEWINQIDYDDIQAAKSFLPSRHTAYQNLLVERIEGMKKEIDSEKTPKALQDVLKNMGCNEAISNIINLIKTGV